MTAFDGSNADIFVKKISEKWYPEFHGGPLQDSRFLDILLVFISAIGYEYTITIYANLNVSMLDMSLNSKVLFL